MVFLGSKEKNTEVLFIHLSNTHCVQRQYRFAELLWFSPIRGHVNFGENTSHQVAT